MTISRTGYCVLHVIQPEQLVRFLTWLRRIRLHCLQNPSGSRGLVRHSFDADAHPIDAHIAVIPLNHLRLSTPKNPPPVLTPVGTEPGPKTKPPKDAVSASRKTPLGLVVCLNVRLICVKKGLHKSIHTSCKASLQTSMPPRDHRIQCAQETTGCSANHQSICTLARSLSLAPPDGLTFHLLLALGGCPMPPYTAPHPQAKPAQGWGLPRYRLAAQYSPHPSGDLHAPTPANKGYYTHPPHSGHPPPGPLLALADPAPPLGGLC